MIEIAERDGTDKREKIPKPEETDDFYEYDKKVGFGSWKDGHAKVVEGDVEQVVPFQGFHAHAYNLATPRIDIEKPSAHGSTSAMHMVVQ